MSIGRGGILSTFSLSKDRSMVGTNLGVQSVRTLGKLSGHARSSARLFPNVDLAVDNPLGQSQREQQNSFTAALDLPSAPGAQGWCARLR